jgi:membrane protease YdiL (CAAX protease family)
MSATAAVDKKKPTKTGVTILLLVWFAANFIPHLVVFLASGKIYYQLSPAIGLATETTLMLLNLLLPLVIIRYISPIKSSLREVGWQWNGWKTILWGLTGFVASIVIMIVVQILFGAQFNESVNWQLNLLERIWTFLLLLGITAFGEEMMFRGYIQTTLTEKYGVWVGIGVTALLFGLRHMPMDLYFGISQQASFSAWMSRLIQLYAGAVVFGIVRYRAKSVWASWIVHEGFLSLIAGLAVLKLIGVLQ